MGRLVEKKGFDDLLRALAYLTQTYSRIKLFLIGGGRLELALKKMAAELKLAGVVEFCGALPNREVIERLLDMHLMVQLSKTAPSGDSEGLPYVLNEAQATGLPIVSTYHAGIPEGVEEGRTGWLVPEGDWRQAAEKIRFFVENPHKLTEFSRNTRLFIQNKFNVEKIVAGDLFNYYNKLLN